MTIIEAVEPLVSDPRGAMPGYDPNRCTLGDLPHAALDRNSVERLFEAYILSDFDACVGRKSAGRSANRRP